MTLPADVAEAIDALICATWDDACPVAGITGREQRSHARAALLAAITTALAAAREAGRVDALRAAAEVFRGRGFCTGAGAAARLERMADEPPTGGEGAGR